MNLYYNEKMKVVNFGSEDDFIKESANFILVEALKSVESKGFFTLGLTGGTTPIKIYNALASLPFKEKFPWDKTYFFLSDERILDKDNPDSNLFMINNSLFSKVDVPIANKIFPEINILSKPEELAKNYETKIKNFYKETKPCFDLLLLGMGLDCHTASLFPDDKNNILDKRLVLATSKPVGTPNVHRVSMSLSLINQSKRILMLISGQEKKQVANELLKNISLGENPNKSPIFEIKKGDEFIWHIN